MMPRQNAGFTYSKPGWCDHCFRFPTPTVRMGEQPTYDAATVELCESCLRLGLAALEAARVIVR